MAKPASSKKTTSRNRARKAEYAAQADKSSRNDIALEKPVIGRFETVETVTRDGSKKTRQILVHDEKYNDEGNNKDVAPQVEQTNTSSTKPKNTHNPLALAKGKKLRRQQFAWKNCCYAKTHQGKHDFSGKRHDDPENMGRRTDRCVTCGYDGLASV